MIPFLPLLGWALGGFLGGLFVGWVIDYLDKQVLKKHIQEQKKQKFSKEVSRAFGEMIGKNYNNGNFNRPNIGLSDMLEESNQINYDTKEIPFYIKQQGKDQIILNLMGKYGYTNRKALLETSLKRLQEMLWFNERNKQRSNAIYNNEYREITNFQSEKEKIIYILVNKYKYQRDWIEDRPLGKLQEMLSELGANIDEFDDEILYRIANTPNEVDWILEDGESRRIFAGKYYNGEVISMEEIKAKEIDPELQWELDNKEIVIL